MNPERETYSEFVKRVSYQQRGLMLPDGAFRPDRVRVYPKVDDAGRLKAFYGDTVVFDLDEEVCRIVAEVQNRLHEKLPQCFAERLPYGSLHMTLHDLSAAESLSEAAPLCFENEVKLAQMAQRGMKIPAEIRMRTNFIVNMVDTSLVMTLLPESPAEWDKLEGVYREIDCVRVCPYPFLTPHITLAYYNRHGFDEATAQALKDLVWELNGEQPQTVILRAENLYYKKFLSMGEYISLFRLRSALSV